jgi:hypothetical protein
MNRVFEFGEAQLAVPQSRLYPSRQVECDTGCLFLGWRWDRSKFGRINDYRRIPSLIHGLFGDRQQRRTNREN